MLNHVWIVCLCLGMFPYQNPQEANNSPSEEALKTLKRLGGTSGTRASGKIADLDETMIIRLENTKVTDADLAVILNIKSPRGRTLGHPRFHIRLNLSHTSITDKGLKAFSTVKRLSGLDLSDTLVTEKGIDELVHLERLAVLNVSGIKLSDAGLARIRQIKGLDSLSLSSSVITDAQLKSLQKDMPKCRIHVVPDKMTPDNKK